MAAHIVWNATATFVAVIIVSLLLDEAGFFEWAALHFARWGGGRGRKLFALFVILGAAVSALFANDRAALILTPIVMAMLVALGFSPATTLAFVMAAGFIASLVSWLLLETTSGYLTKPKSSSAASPPAPAGLRCLTSPLFHRMRPGFANKSQANPPDRHQELSTAGVFFAERLLEFARPGGWCGTWTGSRDPHHAHACGTSHQ